MKTFEKKLQAIENLYPVKDWITNILEKEFERLDKELNVVIDEKDGFFALAIAYQKMREKKPEIAHKMDRITEIMAKRAKQLSNKQKAIYDSLSIDEIEQLIIS
jgi:hypothetical protein